MTTIPPNPEEALVTISTPKSDTVRVRDRVDSSRFELYFDGDVEITSTDSEDLYFPVDIAAMLSGHWSEISVPMSHGVFVHNHHNGEVVHRIGTENPKTDLPPGEYELELIPSPVKIYILVKSEVSVELADGEIQISPSIDAPICVGVRSPHEHPAATIESPDNIHDLMKAVSHLGSALKTTSPERSWPTLRGQPPRMEIGESLDVPAAVSRYDVDVQIEIPTNLSALFNVAPLAYYTSAEVIPLESSDDAALVAGGTRIPLSGRLDEAAGEQLKRNLLLDSVVRSVGIYPIQTSEGTAIGDKLPWSLEEIYEAPLSRRIQAYQEIPQATIEAIWPTWPLTIDVSARISDVPALPHVAEELAIVRVPERDRGNAASQPESVAEFIRADGSGGVGVDRTTNQQSSMNDIERPLEWSTRLHTSLCEGYPLGSNKTSIRAYERHLEREAPDASAIEVKVICNDDEMREEDIVTEFYGLRDLLEFDISTHYNLTTNEFQDIFSESYDLVHYIGHIDENGFKCSDGYIDADSDITDVDFDVFILNACRSVEQGEALLEAGADGGIATLYDVPNSSATKIGRTLSRLLNRGFTIRSALDIARESSVLGDRWVSLGNGRVSLTQPESGVPLLSKVGPQEDCFDFELNSYETASHRIGTIFDLNADWAEPSVLPGTVSRSLSEDELQEFFALEVTPVKCNSGLYWTDEVSPMELRELEK